jgi:hypothetical protein
MTTIGSRIERIVRNALEFRAELVNSAQSVHPNNLADDGKTTVAAALIQLRAAIDAFLAQDDPDNQITGAQSTE